MDYLTVLATRSLIFFPHDSTSPHPLSPNPNNSDSPQTTPEQRTTFLLPEPVYLPLQSLAWADRECALFLLDHLLSSLPDQTPTTMDKRMMADAEGLVWKEVEKGKQFVRAVGEWFGSGVEGGISDYQLKVIGQKCGVVVKDEIVEDFQYAHEHGLGLGHGQEVKDATVHSVQEVILA